MNASVYTVPQAGLSSIGLSLELHFPSSSSLLQNAPPTPNLSFPEEQMSGPAWVLPSTVLWTGYGVWRCQRSSLLPVGGKVRAGRNPALSSAGRGPRQAVPLGPCSLPRFLALESPAPTSAQTKNGCGLTTGHRSHQNLKKGEEGASPEPPPSFLFSLLSQRSSESWNSSSQLAASLIKEKS